MVVATYKSNRKSQPEYIRVHKYSSDGKLRVESIGISYACEVGGVSITNREFYSLLTERLKEAQK